MHKNDNTKIRLVSGMRSTQSIKCHKRVISAEGVKLAARILWELEPEVFLARFIFAIVIWQC